MSAMSADGNDSELLHRKRKVPDTPIQSWWGAVYGPGVEGCGHSGFPEDEDSPWEVVDHHDEDDPIESHGLSVADFCLQVKVIFFWCQTVRSVSIFARVDSPAQPARFHSSGQPRCCVGP
jgi:hypothetical protein